MAAGLGVCRCGGGDGCMIRRYRESGFGRRRRRIRRARTMTEQADSRRTALIAAAQARWVDALTDLGGRNTLLYYKDRRAGPLHPAAAEPEVTEQFPRTRWVPPTPPLLAAAA